MMLALTIALASDIVEPRPAPTATTSQSVTLTEPDYRRYVTESRQLTACREREASHLDALDDSTAGALRLRALLTQCTTEAREVDAELVARVDALTEALARSERRRGRLRTVVVGVVAAVVAVTAWEAVR